MLSAAMLCYAMPCYAMLCYANIAWQCISLDAFVATDLLFNFASFVMFSLLLLVWQHEQISSCLAP